MDDTDDLSSPAPIRLFILDDNEFVRSGLIALIEDLAADVRVVGEAATATEGLRLMLELAPDVVLLDVELPDGDGIAVCRNLRTRHRGIQCLILTGHDEEEALLAAVLAGAAGYLSKQLPAAEILHAVRRAAAGELTLDPVLGEGVLSRLGASPGPIGGPTDTVGNGPPRLAASERSILDLVIAGQTNDQIATQLSLSEKAVRTRLSIIFIKIGLHRRLGQTAHHRRNNEPA